MSSILPIYPLHFTEADLVKGLVKAKQYGKKVMVMYFPRTEFELHKYSDILDIDISLLGDYYITNYSLIIRYLLKYYPIPIDSVLTIKWIEKI